jgi:hypothetical protein
MGLCPCSQKNSPACIEPSKTSVANNQNVVMKALLNRNAALLQQEELEDEEEVWNGDVGSAEDESEGDAAQAQAAPQNMQQEQH